MDATILFANFVRALMESQFWLPIYTNFRGLSVDNKVFWFRRIRNALVTPDARWERLPSRSPDAAEIISESDRLWSLVEEVQALITPTGEDLWANAIAARRAAMAIVGEVAEVEPRERSDFEKMLSPTPFVDYQTWHSGIDNRGDDRGLNSRKQPASGWRPITQEENRVWMNLGGVGNTNSTVLYYVRKEDLGSLLPWVLQAQQRIGNAGLKPRAFIELAHEFAARS